MWTTEQSNAIYSPVTNLLVSASAGSGKTAVMTERIIERIMSDNGTDIDKILVMTYTNAAACEIKERINNKIMQKLDQDPSNARLKKQLALVSLSHISTIHSFCLEIIKSNFNTLGLDPSFRTGDPAEIELIKKDAIDKTFEYFYEIGDKDFLSLVSSYTKRTDNALMDTVIKIYNFSRSFPEPKKWLDNILNTYKNYDISDYCSVLNDKAKIYLKKAISLYEKAIKYCLMDENGGAFAAFLEEEAEGAHFALKISDDWDKMFGFFSEFSFKSRSASLTKNMAPDIAEKCKKLRDDAKSAFQEAKKIYTFDYDTMVSGIRDSYPYVKTIINLTNTFSEYFSEMKHSQALIDYSDYEHLALKCLMDDNGDRTDYAISLASSFEEIYIDEYQDCNNVQEKIFSLVSGCGEEKNNIFMVGDAKQSIYKFRDAEPSLFTDKQNVYKPYEDDVKYDETLITLNKNFRSRKQVLGAINYIFSRIMTQEVGEIDYTDREYLYYNENSSYSDDEMFSDVDIGIINFEPENATDKDSFNTDVAEAVYIAKKIRHLIDSKIQITSKDGVRNIRYSDIAILMRSLRGNTDILSDVLKMYDIPVFTDYNGGYFDCEEISSLISIIKTVLNPLDDINLVSVLRMSLFAFSDEELLKIRLSDKAEFFYNALEIYQSKNNDRLSYKIKNFIRMLEDFREKSKLLSSVEFVNYIINNSGYNEFIISQPLPKQALANVELFINRADNFDKTNFKGIFAFIRFIDDNLKEKADSSTASVINENDDVVRVMSIHKSKGLEFPVVILSRCAKQMNTFDLRGNFILHKKLGIGLKYSNINTHFSYPTISHLAIKEKMNVERLSEEERVLYVALTRAREKLIIVGCMKDAYKKLDKYTEIASSEVLSADVLLDAKCYFDWILPAVFGLECDRSSYIGRYHTDDSAFNVDIVDSHVLFEDDISITGNLDSGILKLIKEADAAITDKETEEKFSYVYPYMWEDIPSSFTVTELKEMANREENTYYGMFNTGVHLDTFEDKTQQGGALMGTAVHLILQKLDIKSCTSEDDVSKICRQLVDMKMISEDVAKYIDFKKIFAFVSGELGQRISNSDAVMKEFPFKIMKNARDLLDEYKDSDETVVLQGTVDLFFENERGNITLVDYKTDKVKSIKDIEDKYRTQIMLYKSSMEEITGKICDECLIYLIQTGDIIKF